MKGAEKNITDYINNYNYEFLVSPNSVTEKDRFSYDTIAVFNKFKNLHTSPQFNDNVKERQILKENALLPFNNKLNVISDGEEYYIYVKSLNMIFTISRVIRNIFKKGGDRKERYKEYEISSILGGEWFYLSKNGEVTSIPFMSIEDAKEYIDIEKMILSLLHKENKN